MKRRLLLPAALAILLAAPSAAGAAATPRFERIDGFAAPGTPARYDNVGILEVGPKSAKNVLILNPGTSLGAAYFLPLAQTVVAQAKGWQVWSVERRENLLEDQSALDRFKAGAATGRQLFDYYLGFTTDAGVASHFRFIDDGDVGFARAWGMRVAVEDLRRVVGLARRRGGKVVVGGHSLGGVITTAYATWDFGGRAGARDLAGLVFIDGASGPGAPTAAQATQSLQALSAGSPWLGFGVRVPIGQLYNVVGAGLAGAEPDAPSLLGAWSGNPPPLAPPVSVTNLAAFGFAHDPETSPAALGLPEASVGRLAATGDPRGWDQAGERSPIRRYAAMLSGQGLKGLDGIAWYHPMRLTIDAGAVSDGNANGAQTALGMRATHGRGLPKSLRMYAFGAVAATQVLGATTTLARQSGIPSANLTLVDRHATYAHDDPAAAAPANDFVRSLLPFLAKIASR